MENILVARGPALAHRPCIGNRYRGTVSPKPRARNIVDARLRCTVTRPFMTVAAMRRAFYFSPRKRPYESKNRIIPKFRQETTVYCMPVSVSLPLSYSLEIRRSNVRR